MSMELEFWEKETGEKAEPWNSHSEDKSCGPGQGGELVIYGCMSGKSPSWPWQSWIMKGLRVQGFNFNSWMAKNVSKVSK